MSVPLPLDTKKKPFYTFVKSGRWIAVVGIVVLVGIGVGLTRELVRQARIRAEINQLEQEIAGLANRNEELSGLIEYFQSDAFLELEARARLNVQKPGEKVIEVQKSDGPVNVSEVADLSRQQPRNNPARWWQFLFGQPS